MILQLEDAIDMLQVLHGDQYEFVFYFDHSSGHDRLQPDGLNCNKMNKSYGGSQNNAMRNTIIDSETYLGPYSSNLQVGDTQLMQFCEGDVGFVLDIS